MQKFIFRIVTESEWKQAQTDNIIPKRPVDVSDGYYHLSAYAQVIETLNKHFTNESDVLCLAYHEQDLAKKIKWELAPSRGQDFPHYYGTLPFNLAKECYEMKNSKHGWQWGKKKG
ncbi:MAG: DUF952 domain-containing protein [bacterium]